MIKISNIIKAVIGALIMTALIVFLNTNKPLFGTGVQFEAEQFRILYILAIGTFVLLLIDKRMLYPSMYKILGIISVLAIPFILMQISMTLAGDSEYTFPIYMMNTLLYFIPIVIMYIITDSFPVSGTVAVLLGSLFNITSYVLNNLRGTPFIPTDILAINTAAKVASNYEFTFEWPLVYAIVMTVFAIVLLWAFPLKIKFKKSPIICRGAGAAVLAIILGIFSHVSFSKVSMDVFDQYHANNTHGTAYSFFINCCKMRLEKPSHYNESDVIAMLDTMKDDTPIPEDKPNVIVIMNESYSDLKLVGDFKTNIPYNSFFMSLKKNTVRGEVIVSPFGGYTCNTEFEFLSGLSMGLLPSGGTPYLQYINKKCPYFLPDYMNSLGYTTIALHPYYARCWNRSTVYPLMEFDNFISIDNMGDYQDADQFELMRSFLSDNTSYSALINQLETKGEDERLFIFNVTMQNHGGYTYGGADFDNNVKITSMRGDYPQAEQYLSLVQRSDRALEILIDYLRDFNEPTVLVMFGDHQPGVEQEFYEELYGMPLSEVSAENLLKRYTIPFIIWTNYEQESRDDVVTSMNYLSDLVLESANLPKSKISLFHTTIKDNIPMMNASGHKNINGEWEPNDTYKSEALKNYADIEYFMLTHKPTGNEKP